MSGAIVTLGSGGFSTDGPQLLDDHIIGLSRRPGDPRICFVPTASGDAPTYIERFERAFKGRALTSVLRLFSRDVEDLRAHVLEQDVVYVGGGNTVSLLAVWRAHGLDAILAEALAANVVLAGISAGMNCWFEGSVTDSYGVDRLDPVSDGLGLLPGSCCPHYDDEIERRPTYLRLVGSGELPDGYAAQAEVALVFRDRTLVDAVSSYADGRAFRVERRPDGSVVEEPLAVRDLSAD